MFYRQEPYYNWEPFQNEMIWQNPTTYHNVPFQSGYSFSPLTSQPPAQLGSQPYSMTYKNYPIPQTDPLYNQQSMQQPNPLYNQKLMPQPPMYSFLSHFHDKNGKLDINKMMSTIGQISNTVKQVSPLFKQFGSLFGKIQ